jgi:hypothetical protein
VVPIGAVLSSAVPYAVYFFGGLQWVRHCAHTKSPAELILCYIPYCTVFVYMFCSDPTDMLTDTSRLIRTRKPWRCTASQLSWYLIITLNCIPNANILRRELSAAGVVGGAILHPRPEAGVLPAQARCRDRGHPISKFRDILLH